MDIPTPWGQECHELYTEDVVWNMDRVQYKRWTVIVDFHLLLFPKPMAGEMGIVRMISKPGDYSIVA